MHFLVELTLHLLIRSIDVMTCHELHRGQLHFAKALRVLLCLWLITEDIVVGVRRPEPLYKFLLGDEVAVRLVQPCQECFRLLV